MYEDSSLSDRGRFAGRSTGSVSGGNIDNVVLDLSEGGRYVRGVKVGLVASAIVASVSMVELDRP